MGFFGGSPSLPSVPPPPPPQVAKPKAAKAVGIKERRSLLRRDRAAASQRSLLSSVLGLSGSQANSGAARSLVGL